MPTTLGGMVRRLVERIAQPRAGLPPWGPAVPAQEKLTIAKQTDDILELADRVRAAVRARQRSEQEPWREP